MLTDEVLKILLSSDRAVSGNDISARLGVTRAAVWKAVEKLKDDGYHIESVRKTGYLLKPDSDVLSRVKMMMGLEHQPQLFVFEEIASTDVEARKLFDGGYTIVAAEKQSAGITVSSAEFISPKDTGLYFSMTLKPVLRGNIRARALRAVCDALSVAASAAFAVGGCKITHNGRNVAAVSCYETKLYDETVSVTVGVGVNVYAKDFGYGGNFISLYDVTGKYLNRSDLLCRIANGVYAALLMERNESRSYRAERLFMSGCNCCQATLAAFSDDLGIAEEQLIAIASAFGAGYAQTRKQCGAVSAMGMVLGLMQDGWQAGVHETNAAVYDSARKSAQEFERRLGSTVCAELLKNVQKVKIGGSPSERTAEYYRTRPCLKLVLSAVNILEDMLNLQ